MLSDKIILSSIMIDIKQKKKVKLNLFKIFMIKNEIIYFLFLYFSLDIEF